VNHSYWIAELPIVCLGKWLESLEVRMLGPAEIVILFCLQALELVSLPAFIHFLFTNNQ